MTKDELARALRALGPGAALPVRRHVLAAALGVGLPLSEEAVEAARAFAAAALRAVVRPVRPRPAVVRETLAGRGGPALAVAVNSGGPSGWALLGIRGAGRKGVTNGARAS